MMFKNFLGKYSSSSIMRSVSVSVSHSHSQLLRLSSSSSSSSGPNIGLIGLGQMGSKIVAKFKEDGKNFRIYDANQSSIEQLADQKQVHASSLKDMAANCDLIISILPNDSVVSDVSNQLLSHKPANRSFIHVSCSTISPVSSRKMETTHKDKGSVFVASPVFARPDGLANRQATWMVSGNKEAKEVATPILNSLGNVVDFGEDVGAANVVKLCGNFLIASSIESIGEAMALSEKHGVDRTKVMDLLSSTIFNCLIYKGYGQRVSERDHRPGGFSLALGLKDVSLVSQAAKEADVPMPFLSVLMDRYVSSKARGRADFDWSAIGLSIAEDAGIDVSKDIDRTRKEIKEGKTY